MYLGLEVELGDFLFFHLFGQLIFLSFILISIS